MLVPDTRGVGALEGVRVNHTASNTLVNHTAGVAQNSRFDSPVDSSLDWKLVKPTGHEDAGKLGIAPLRAFSLHK